MKTRKTNTRFMSGNIDVEGLVFDLLVEKYGLKEVCESGIDFDNAIYSDGFINAIENGLIPSLELTESFLPKKDAEYHHVIIEDKCYVMYFE